VTDESVFTGDAYIPGIAVVTNLPKGNKEQAKQSVQKILDLASYKTIYPGHRLP
jgi:glyoxylase-like metal-dependent hydrolase (beta-lactamase superfamily II)